MAHLRGAEAILVETTFEGVKALRKVREKKEYRNPTLDVKLRRTRTKREAKILRRAFEAGVLCPQVFGEGEFEIIFSFIPGKLASEKKLSREQLERIAIILAKLHSLDIIHGDFTPANLIVGEDNQIWVIDFGLGYFSNRVEDKAVDVFTMKQALDKKEGEEFVEKYEQVGSMQVVERMREVEKRARYQER
ncbi:MAG: KEOPS complex kinase/ATPase Bud32 [Candidatus Anstonellales archaeon]